MPSVNLANHGCWLYGNHTPKTTNEYNSSSAPVQYNNEKEIGKLYLNRHTLRQVVYSFCTKPDKSSRGIAWRWFFLSRGVNGVSVLFSAGGCCGRHQIDFSTASWKVESTSFTNLFLNHKQHEITKTKLPISRRVQD